MKTSFKLSLCVVFLSFGGCLPQTPERVFPKITAIMEMAPFDKYEKAISSASATDQAKFDSQWKNLANWVEGQVSPEMLRQISRWAVEEMKTFAPARGWAQNLPMQPLFSSDDERYILFSQEPERGFPIPSHHPIVFRRIVLAAVYDTKTKSILEIYVTIRGWKEE